MRGRQAGRAGDIWSLGVTLHLVLTGHGHFPALVSANLFPTIRLYLRSQPGPDEGLSDGARAVVVTAPQPERARRYRTAGDFAEAVEGVAGHLAGRAPS
jgi:serine/threonine-protein kinase